MAEAGSPVDPPEVTAEIAAPGRLSTAQVEEHLQALDQLLLRVETLPGEGGEVARDAITALALVYGEALARALSGASARALAADPLVGHLMALHGLHPDSTEERVEQLLADVRHQLGDRSVRLAGIESGVAHVEVTASGCGSDGLAGSVSDLLLGEAPELAGIEATSPAPTTFIPLDSLRTKR